MCDFYRSLLLVLLCYNSGFAQFAIKGKVVDEQTKEPLAFVNVIFNHDDQAATTADINGIFSYSSSTPFETLTCSYVGYDKKTIPLDALQDGELVIEMHIANLELREVVVKAGDNPANRIIRKVIENRPVNNPEKISSFKYTSYNKIIYDFDFSDSLTADDGREKLDSFFKGGHIFVMESVTERKFIRPDNSEETILGVEVSGFKHSSFAPLATDIQPFSFYNDIITVLDIDYLNPVSSGSLSKYSFTLEDTLLQGRDTTYIISFKPLAGKNFEALTGVLYINTFNYAIQHVIARPDKIGFIDVNLQQQYSLIDGKQWFPEQLKFELLLRQNASMAVGVRASGVSFIDHVELYPELKKKDFSLEAVKMDEMANQRDSLFWLANRPVGLSEREKNTFRVIDSLGTKYKFDNMLSLGEKLAQNKIAIGFMDIDLARVIRYNKFEGVRIGLGAYTNDKLIRNFSLGGYFGYGLKDHQWKYGGEAIVTVDKERELVLTAGYDNTLLETGKSDLGFFRPRQFYFRNFLASQMDRIQQSKLALGFRAIRYAKVNISLSNSRIDPQYTYAYQPVESEAMTNFINSSITLNLRYAYKEKLIKSMGQRISMGTTYPVLTLSYSRGIKDFFNGQFSYHKFEVMLEKSVYIKNVGESSLRIDAGVIDHPLPYGLLFTGEGSYVHSWPVLIKNSFMTVSPYEFLSDHFVSLYYAHKFGSLLFHVGNWKPSITLFQNIGWGRLSNPEYHQYVSFKTKEKGLYESGLQLDNLVKLNYLNVAYMGFGAGAFIRYGPYASGKFGNNLAFTLSMTFTTK